MTNVVSHIQNIEGLQISQNKKSERIIDIELKDELIRATIMDTQDDVEEIKETIKKIDQRLYEMTR